LGSIVHFLYGDITMSKKSHNFDYLDADSELDWLGLPRGSAVVPPPSDSRADAPIVAGEDAWAVRGAGSLGPLPTAGWSMSQPHLDRLAGGIGLDWGQPREVAIDDGLIARSLDSRSSGDIGEASMHDSDYAGWHRVALPTVVQSSPMLSLLGRDDMVAVSSGKGPPTAAPRSIEPESAAGAAFVEPAVEAPLAAAATPWIPYRTTSEIKVVSETGQDYSSAVAIAVNQAATGSIGSATDVDYFKVNLTAGQTYTFAASSFGKQAITDLKIDLYQSVAGLPLLKGSDDASGPLYGAQYTVTAASTGTYYIKVSKGSETTAPATSSTTGQYLLTVGQGLTPYHPVGTLSELADYLTHTDHRAAGGDWAAFDKASTGPRILTYDINSLSDVSKYNALNAMANWQDVANIRFVENTGTGMADITFQSVLNEFASSRNVFGNTILQVSLFVPSSDDDASRMNFMKYVADGLGLGYPGPFQNDDVSISVMSDVTTDITQSGAGYILPSTVMLADIPAIQNLYGANTTTRIGNDIYGFNATDPRFSFSSSGSNMFTIYDRGGTDTLDASGYSQDQRIDLRAGQYSDIGAVKNVIAISTVGTIIENAKGGSGADTITGNGAGNLLAGNGGNDIIHGGDGNDTLQGGAGNDQLYGEAKSDRLLGGAGNDILVGGADADRFVMDAGWGSDTIQDFQDGVDKVEIYMVPGLTNFTQFSEADTGSDVRLTWNNNTPTNSGDDLVIVILGREPAQIEGSDFVFVV
jgi:serralysin